MKPLPILLALAVTLHAAPPEPKFRAITLDDKIQIGYGLAIADVDGDKAPDILLADKKQFVWYRNPGASKAGDPAAWTKFVFAEDLTKNDNVCIAAQDIDGDGKCEVAVGAEWNPGDTVNSGAVFYLIPPADRTQKWEPVKLYADPTTHRMRWIKLEGGKWGLVVVPLHGEGNKNGEGDPVRVLLYEWAKSPPKDASGKWTVIIDALHMTHNFDVLPRRGYADQLLLAGKEGVVRAGPDYDSNRSIIVGGAGTSQPNLAPTPAPVWIEKDFKGAGEVRLGTVTKTGTEFVATIEPMHGNTLAIYPGEPMVGKRTGPRRVLSDKLTEGHALACGDLLGMKSDQIVVGWRGTPGKEGSTIGVHVWTPLDENGKEWRDSAVDDTGMACEDLQLADLDGDGKLDIIASGRATKNVKIYFNETPR